MSGVVGQHYVVTDCQTCQLPIEGHLQCAACWIFAGAGHYDTALLGGLCETCRARDDLYAVDEGMERRKERRAEALRIFESRGMGAVRARFRVRKQTAQRMVAQARREATTA